MNTTKIIIGVTSVILLTIGIGIFQTIASFNDGLLDITVSPTDARIKIDGKGSAKPGKISLAPGEHTLEVTRKGYASKTLKIKITSGNVTTEGVQLTVSDPAAVAKENAELNKNDVTEQEGVAGKIVNEQGAKIAAENPLITKLPFYGADFNIDVGKSEKYPNDGTAVAIYITAITDEGRTHALNWIKAQGYDPAAYEIIYSGSH
ncbi:MAG: hypothetical protein K0S68_232 [Candidatus Saccharibacteria bacterium]|jgi:hypothetical protein|nr:hypothetical protein [Candidatus Saccharibacteria bacterium]